MSNAALPPLPEPLHGFYAAPMYTADQMQRYAADALEALYQSTMRQAMTIAELTARADRMAAANREFIATAEKDAAEIEAWRKLVDELKAEEVALRADAERYRWLRKGGGLWGICVWDDDEWVGDARTNVDAAIDAAIEAGKAVNREQGETK